MPCRTHTGQSGILRLLALFYVSSDETLILPGNNYEQAIQERLGDNRPKEILFFSWTPHSLTVCDPLRPNATFYSWRTPGESRYDTVQD